MPLLFVTETAVLEKLKYIFYSFPMFLIQNSSYKMFPSHILRRMYNSFKYVRFVMFL